MLLLRDSFHTVNPSEATWSRLPDQDDRSGLYLTHERLRALARDRETVPCVTLTMPTHQYGPEVRQDPTRLLKLLAEAEERLGACGVPPEEIRRILALGRAALDDRELWQQGREGLAVLLSAPESHLFRLPHDVATRCDVSTHFRVTPLLRLAEDDRFVVLAVSRARVQLLAGDRQRLHELPLGDLPTSLEEVVGHRLSDATLQWHSIGHAGPGRGSAVHHGHGAGNDDQDHELTRFARAITDALPKCLPDPDTPVVLAAVERTIAELRRFGQGLRLTPEPILGDPHGLSPDQLHGAAWERMQPLLEAPTHEALERFRQRSQTEQAALELAEVLKAGVMGRIDTLLVAWPPAPAWGTFDAQRATMERHQTRQPHSDDLVDRAVALALARGATVLAVPRAQMPEQRPLAALHRF